MSIAPSDRIKLSANEQILSTAKFINTIAGGLFTVGLVVLVSAVLFGYGNTGQPLSLLKFVLGALIFMVGSFGVHLLARRHLGKLQG